MIMLHAKALFVSFKTPAPKDQMAAIGSLLANVNLCDLHVKPATTTAVIILDRDADLEDTAADMRDMLGRWARDGEVTTDFIDRPKT